MAQTFTRHFESSSLALLCPAHGDVVFRTSTSLYFLLLLDIVL
jgi:hypothetical protein